MGGGSKSSQTVGYRYYMSLHMGLCRGPIDEIVQINVGDVRAWPVADGDSETISGLATIAEGPGGTGIALYENGSSAVVSASSINTVRTSGDYAIAAPSLFGGDKKEGGISGSLRVMMGLPSQIVPTWIKNLMGGNVPNFRGVATMFFDGLLCSLNPYPKQWQIRVRRTTGGWDGDVWQPSLVTIWMRDGTIKAMNPAHIIYECLTNRDWGRGMSRSLLLDAKWLSSATTLYNEGLGLCMRYTRQSDLSEFIQDVLDHIGGSIYPDRSTGQLALDLLRSDYDVETLPLFTFDSGLISLEESETSSQEDVTNEIIVKWTDPIQREERSARWQNLAVHQSFGGALNSTTRTYAGVPEVGLALRLAQRDGKASANALKRYTVVLDRRAWRMVTGDVFRVSVPERNIYNVVLRAGKITRSADDGKITVEAPIDVFGMPYSSFISAQPTEWVPPSREPLVPEHRVIREATYPELVRAMDAANLQILPVTAATVATVVARPNSTSLAYSVLTRADGEDADTEGNGQFAPYVELSDAITAGQTVATFSGYVDIGLVDIGYMVQIGNEMCRLDGIDYDQSTDTGTITISRGCVDTIPEPHGAGSIAFIIDDEIGGDGREYVSGETVSVKVLPYTSTNTLSQSLAPTDTVDLIGRQGLPYAPGNVRVDGNPFYAITTMGSNVVVTWAHRDRLTQQDQLIPHGDPSVGPEAGVSYRIRTYAGDTTTAVRNETTSGTTYTYTAAMATADGVTDSVYFELEALRESYTSFSKYRFGGARSTVPAPTVTTVVLVSNPSETLFTTGPFVRLPLYTETTDTEDAWNSDNRYLVPSDGNYRFTVDVGFDGATTELTTGSTWDLQIDDYATVPTALVTGRSSSGTYDGSTAGYLQTTLALTAGQIKSAYLRHNNGSDVTLASALLRIERIT